MKTVVPPTPACPFHGGELKRTGCSACRAAYMR